MICFQVIQFDLIKTIFLLVKGFYWFVFPISHSFKINFFFVKIFWVFYDALKLENELDFFILPQFTSLGWEL